jgi:hypothetical protein
MRLMSSNHNGWPEWWGDEGIDDEVSSTHDAPDALGRGGVLRLGLACSQHFVLGELAPLAFGEVSQG